jgi:hypothetical protein
MKSKNHSEYIYNNISSHDLIDSYVFPKDLEFWKECPHCKLKPKVWIYNNGASTGCGCHNSTYDHWSVNIESIGSVINRTGSCVEYGGEELLKEYWNHWCETGEIIFDRDYEKDGKW